jgi:hypothetical protein
MDAVKDVALNCMDETPLNTITIRKRGPEVIIAWRTAASWADYVVINAKLLMALDGDLKLTLAPKNTPTSASPQG